MVIQKAVVSWDSIKVGDKLPSVRIKESQEDFDNYSRLNAREGQQVNLGGHHHNQEYAQEHSMFRGTVNMGPSTCAFMVQVLQEAFPVQAIARGTFSMRATEPIRPDDEVIYTGEVVGKREENGKRIVEVALLGTNQLSQTVAQAQATVVL